MKILVAVASKHGSTQEIAFAISRELRTKGLDADVKNVQNVDSIEGYDAVILGSAVYAARWLPEASDFVSDFEAELRQRPLWLFSSGPVGRKLNPEPNKVVKIQNIIDRLQPKDHKLFAGKVEPGHLNILWRPVMRAAGAEGDFRDWEDIRLWAAGIAHQSAKIAVN